MSRRPAPRLSYANVTATIALFVALATGGAYASHQLINSSDVVDNSLRGIDLRNDEVRSVDVRDDTLRGGGLAAADLRPGSVTASEIRNGALTNLETDPLVSGAGDNFSVVPFDLSAPEGVSKTAAPWGNDSLLITAHCKNLSPGSRASISRIQFSNMSDSLGSLNWLYGQDSDTSAWGTSLSANGGTRSFGFDLGRMEGHFLYADADSKISINLHAFDGDADCQAWGTAVRAAD